MFKGSAMRVEELRIYEKVEFKVRTVEDDKND